MKRSADAVNLVCHQFHTRHFTTIAIDRRAAGISTFQNSGIRDPHGEVHGQEVPCLSAASGYIFDPIVDERISKGD